MNNSVAWYPPASNWLRLGCLFVRSLRDLIKVWTISRLFLFAALLSREPPQWLRQSLWRLREQNPKTSVFHSLHITDRNFLMNLDCDQINIFIIHDKYSIYCVNWLSAVMIPPPQHQQFFSSSEKNTATLVRLNSNISSLYHKSITDGIKSIQIDGLFEDI